jgi:hypothetical protein
MPSALGLFVEPSHTEIDRRSECFIPQDVSIITLQQPIDHVEARTFEEVRCASTAALGGTSTTSNSSSRSRNEPIIHLVM